MGSIDIRIVLKPLPLLASSDGSFYPSSFFKTQKPPVTDSPATSKSAFAASAVPITTSSSGTQEGHPLFTLSGFLHSDGTACRKAYFLIF
jgi:hypothetical protein